VAGFPVTITGVAGRSYRLTSDLSIASPNLDAILISTNDVTLNLGGFRESLTELLNDPC
jgi:hypothetical protein